MKYLIIGVMVLSLVVSLGTIACASATPVQEVPEQKTAEVQQWEPSGAIPSGPVWEDLVYACDLITKMSDGRIVATASSPGGICPVEEQFDTVATGATEAMCLWPSYFTGQVPLMGLYGDSACATKTIAQIHELYEVYEGGRIRQLIQEELRKYGDLQFVENDWWFLNSIIISTVPLNGVNDLRGVPFRSSEMVAETLAALGAGTVWAPGSEIYTMLSTGVVDGVTYASAADDVAMSWHEVTKYWVKKPTVQGAGTNMFIVNGTVWQALPDDLKYIVQAAVDTSRAKCAWTLEMEIDKAWKFVEDYGIKIIEWSDEDCATYYEALRGVQDKYRTNPACAEFLNLVEKYMVEKGIW